MGMEFPETALRADDSYRAIAVGVCLQRTDPPACGSPAARSELMETMGLNLKLALILAAGGALGTLARYGLSILLLPLSQTLPWGTIFINIAGSFLIGAFGTLTLAHGRFPLSESARLFVMVGVCGGFTTFSSFSLQTLDLLRAGAPGRAAINIIVSVALCVGAVALGHTLASHLNGGATRIAQIEEEELG